MDRRKDLEETVDNCKKIINTCEEIINKAQKKISELKKDKKEQWIPEYGEKYWYYDKDLEICVQKFWEEDRWDKLRLENTRVFKTIKEVERYEKYQKAKKEYTYKFTKAEWENKEIAKWSIECNYEDYKKRLNICLCYMYRGIGIIAFKTQEKVQEFIDKYKKEILEYEFEIVED